MVVVVVLVCARIIHKRVGDVPWFINNIMRYEAYAFTSIVDMENLAG
jgi:hypothetical protein